MTKRTMNQIVKIVHETIPELETREDLERHYWDEEDFFETSVWSLKAALEAAYELGRKSR